MICHRVQTPAGESERRIDAGHGLVACDNAMPLFDVPNANYPKRWKEYSFDFQLMFVYHGSMMLLFIAGSMLSVKQELLGTALLVAILVSSSLEHRRNMNWHWPGVQSKGILSAAGTLVLATFFELAAIPLAPPSNPRFLPWYMAGAGIAAFGVLSALRLVHLSKADFIRNCEAIGVGDFRSKLVAEAVPTTPMDPLWKRTTRAIYGICFLLLWIGGVASFYYFGVAFRDGSPRPTPTHTEPLKNHGQIKYIPHSQKVLVDSLQTVMLVGMPCIVVAGLILHFFVGVKMYPNMSTFEEWKKRRFKN